MIPSYLKKFKRLILISTLKPKAFLILFALFFSSLAFAATLTVTLLDGRIPSHNSNFCQNSDGEFVMNKDSTEDPYDVAFSTDGLQVFTVNHFQESVRGKGNLSMNRLSRPFDMTSVISDQHTATGKPDMSCDAIDAFKVANLAGASAEKLRNIVVADGGRKFFISNRVGRIMRFDLSTPNEFKTNTFVQSIVTHADMHGFALSDDGTKLITIRFTDSTPLVTTYQLPNPYDISSITQIHQVDLTDIGVTLPEGTNFGRDIEFSKSGHAMFVLIQHSTVTPVDKSDIFQFTLDAKFDVSTAKLVGNYDVNNLNTTNGLGHPIGFTFSNDGMRMFMVQINSGTGVDQVNSYQLECPYGVVACVSAVSATVVSQVELANQNISLNVTTIFKRFEWIKRNRDNEDLTSHNININYPNPLLKSLVSKFEPSLKNNLVSLVSNNQKKEEKKKSKWSSWSLMDFSIGDYEETLFDEAKGIKTKGITFGSDRKIGDDKFFGLALRYGNGASNIRRTVQNVDLESLTLNLYGIVPTNNNQYINTVLGLSALRFDNEYSGKLSGERNGKQAFASINYRTKNAYSKFNITPTGKLTYGVTKLSEFTDFISKAADRPATDIRFHEDTFESGEFAGGLLFEMDKIEKEGATTQPMGGIEIIYDLADDNTYKYSNVGSTVVNKETINSYSNKKLKTNIGVEHIVENGFTIFFDYENIMSLDNCERCVHSGVSQNFNNETLIIKISKSKEENTQFAFDFDPLSNNLANLSYSKNTNNLNLKFNSNMNLFTKIPDYGANIEISSHF